MRLLDVIAKQGELRRLQVRNSHFALLLHAPCLLHPCPSPIAVRASPLVPSPICLFDPSPFAICPSFFRFSPVPDDADARTATLLFAQFLFELHDLDKDGALNQKEMTDLMER